MGYYDEKLNFVNKYGGRYDTYGASSFKDLFTSENTRGVLKKHKDSKVKGRLRNIYQAANSIALASNIYFNYLMMMVQDAIAGDVAQMTRLKYPLIHVGLLSRAISDSKLDVFKNEIEAIDIRKLDYRFPRVMMHFGPKSIYVDRVINVPKVDFNRMHQHIRDGKVYPKFKTHVKPRK